jgi:NDP-sugar pyrophosphorylase family protein
MLNIVVPMAGAGRRFAEAGYKVPKPLIPIEGVPMIRLVIENLRPTQPHRFVFVCQSSHVERYTLKSVLEDWAPGAVVVEVDGLTEGAACTVLAAREFIANEEALMIANSDQWVDASIDDYLRAMTVSSVDGLVMTMTANDPKWSYVELGSANFVKRVAEKEVISNEATVGIYNFRRGLDFVLAAESMIRNNLRVNSEFYVAPVFNVLIRDGFKVGIHNVGSELAGMYGLGTPADLERFLKDPIHKRALAVVNA